MIGRIRASLGRGFYHAPFFLAYFQHLTAKPPKLKRLTAKP
ncbi:hypothetical protein [Helicobacter pylori]|nr:hypothetical protein [Helicobacter pylori]